MCYILNGDTQWTKAIDYAEKAIRLSPRDPFLFVFYAQIGRAEIGLQHYDRAIEWFRRSVAENPDFPTPIANLASELALNGHEAEAREVLARYLAHPRTVTRTIDQIRAQAHGPGDTVQFDRFLEGLRKAGMPGK